VRGTAVLGGGEQQGVGLPHRRSRAHGGVEGAVESYGDPPDVGVRMLFPVDRQDADPIVLRVDAGVGETDERHERAVGRDRRLAVGAVVAGERPHVCAVDRILAVVCDVDDVQVSCSIAVPGVVALR
jgi:hypothetical protein